MALQQTGRKATLELFCGTKSFSRVAAAHGYETFTVDIVPQHEPDLCADVLQLTAEELLAAYRRPEVMWASIPCTTFSIAGWFRHWKKIGSVYYPKSEEAKRSVELAKHTLALIRELQPRCWIIENPRGLLRKMPFMQGIGRRRTVTYCQYGDVVRKPTDIWTNFYSWQPRRMCRNGDSCHVSSPRGANAGVRTMKRGPIERSIVPAALCEEIMRACEVA